MPGNKAIRSNVTILNNIMYTFEIIFCYVK